MPNFFGFWADLLPDLLLVLIVVVIIGALIVAFRYRSSAMGGTTDWTPDETEAETTERLERLPVQLEQPKTNLLDEAKRLMEAGQFNEAIIYVFSHELVQLDRFQFVRLARGKTNHQYLRELSGNHQLAGIMKNTIHVFEDAFFGDHRISETRFQYCWDELRSFHQLIAQSLEGSK